jgi:hypothetical protein
VATSRGYSSIVVHVIRSRYAMRANRATRQSRTCK